MFLNSKTYIAVKKSFLITLAYVGSGTLTLLIMCSDMDNPGDFINGLLTIVLFLTIPVTCVSFAVIYSDKHQVHAVLLIQSITFLLFWSIALINNTA